MIGGLCPIYLFCFSFDGVMCSESIVYSTSGDLETLSLGVRPLLSWAICSYGGDYFLIPICYKSVLWDVLFRGGKRVTSEI